MLQAANTDFLSPLVTKALNSECQNLLFPLQIKPVKVKVKVSLQIYIFCTHGTDGLNNIKSFAVLLSSY